MLPRVTRAVVSSDGQESPVVRMRPHSAPRRTPARASGRSCLWALVSGAAPGPRGPMFAGACFRISEDTYLASTLFLKEPSCAD